MTTARQDGRSASDDAPGTHAISIEATPLQAGMLFHAAAHPKTGVDVEQISIDLHHALDVDRFSAAWQRVVDRHPILSARFAWGDQGQALLQLGPPDRVEIRQFDWSSFDDDRVNEFIEQTRRQDRVTDFDLSSGPLNRFHLARISPTRWWALWSFHHSILDGRSFPLVLREVFSLYDNPAANLGPVADYQRYVEAVTGADRAEAELHWKAKLARLESSTAIPAVTTPATGDEPTQLSPPAPSVDYLEHEIGVDATERLRRLAADHDVTLNTCVQAAWLLLLAHYTQQDLVAFGTTRACRHVVEGSADMVGLLINTVPLLVDIDDEEPVGALLARLRGEQRALRGYETTPLQLIGRCAPGSTGELFTSIVVYDDASLDARMRAAFPHHGDRRRFRYDGQTNYPLTLLAYGDESLLVRLEYDVDRYGGIGRQLLDHYIALLVGLAEDPTRPAMDVAYLADAEHAQHERWNTTAVDYDLDVTLASLFERQVAATPDHVALALGDRTLTYAEVDARANQLAWHLRERGVGRDVPVGVFAERSFEMMVAIYAVTKAGGAYVPLDPEHPSDRVRYMAEDAGLGLVLTQGHLAPQLPGCSAERIVLDDTHPEWSGQPTAPLPPVAGPDDLAYILYTSGSTGRPKGVMIEHRAIVNRLLWMQQAFGLTADDCVLQKTPYTFDVSVWELFWPLQVGARLALAEPGGHRDPAYLAVCINDHDVTTLHFVPSMLQLFVDEPTARHCRTIRRIVCSGEALPRSLQDRTFEVLDTELHNLYGPTEAAVDVTWWECDADSPLPTVPIGRPIANTEIHVLDRRLRRVPVGVTGELHIGGVQLARGYHNRRELTAERFVPDPYTSRPGGRLYKTGDLVRHLPDGAVDFLGRLDHQVKIRGQRIELGEIEAVIADHPSIREAIVIAHGNSAAETQLVAYAVGDTHDLADHEAAEVELRRHCERMLAPHMVPSVWMFLASLPLSPNGKVDRRSLPEPTRRSPSGPSTATATATEAEVLEVWQTLLGDTPIGTNETFFDVGGNSLLLVRLSQLLTARYGRNIAVPQLLRHPTISQQANLVEGKGAGPVDDAVVDGAATASARRRARSRRR